MLTLIKRELYDHLALLVLLLLISLLLIGTILYTTLLGMGKVSVVIGAITLPGLLAIFSGLGTSQMNTDRTNRISALLAMLAVTRGRIFAARVITGVILIFLALAPVALVVLLLLYQFVPLSFYWPLIGRMSITVLLVAFACYCAGLQIGWTTNKTLMVVGGLLLLALIVPLVVIKGFGIEAVAMLALLNGAMLLRAWKNYSVASL